MTATLGDDWR
jgi:hypothetical protein